MLREIEHRIVRLEDYLVDTYFSEYGTRIAFVAYAFVFFYYGFLKVVPGVTTPVQASIVAFVEGLGIPTLAASLGLPYGIGPLMLLVGFYEMVLGALFATRRLRAAFVLFFLHQFTTLATLIVAPQAYFQQPFLQVAGLGVPWLFDAFAAYVMKNVVFIGGFVVLTSLELGHGTPTATTRGDTDRSPSATDPGD
jgi:uncharacterized membrane protein YkgB